MPMPGVIKRRAAGMIMGTALRELKKEAEMSEPLRDAAEESAPPDPGEPEPTVSEGHVRAVPEEELHAGPDTPGPGLPPPSAIESIVGALLDAGPEVAEHIAGPRDNSRTEVRAAEVEADRR